MNKMEDGKDFLRIYQDCHDFDIVSLGGCPRILSVTKKSENETKFSQI